MVPARNKAKCLSLVNHTTKAIHHSSCNKAREETNDCFKQNETIGRLVFQNKNKSSVTRFFTSVK